MKKNQIQKKPLLLLGATALALVLVAVSAGTVVANGGSLWDKIAQVAGVVLGQGLLEKAPANGGLSDVLGGTAQALDRGTGNRTDVLTLKDSNSDVSWEEFVEVIPMIAATSSLSWLQKYDGIVELQVQVVPQGTASASMKFAVGTSTVANAPNWDVDLASNFAVPQGLIPVEQAATGSNYNSFVRDSSSLNNVAFAGLRASSTWVRVPQSLYVTFFRTTGGSNAIHGSSATSSAGSGLDIVNSFLSIRVRRMATTTP